MTLQKPRTLGINPPDDTPEVPPSIPRDRYDRPLIVPPAGGMAVAYTRASTLGKTIEDDYHLSRWAQRNVALGLGRRPDLVALAAAVRSNDGDGRAALDDICGRAREAAGGNQGANIGTALHALSERQDAGEDLSWLPNDLHDALNWYTAMMAPLRVLAAETFVVHDGLQTAGSFDRVVELTADLAVGDEVIPAGTVCVVDLKTGKAGSGRYWGAGYAVQQYVYATGQPYRPDTGRGAWGDLLGRDAPSQEWALILHVPSNDPDSAGFVAVDLQFAAHLAKLCVDVRAARQDAKRAFVPAAFDFTGVWAADQDPLLAQIREALDPATLDELWQANTATWQDEHTAAVRARLAEIEAA